MSLSKESEVSDDLMSLEELTFVAATLFFTGSILSLYIAYKNLKQSDSDGGLIFDLIP